MKNKAPSKSEVAAELGRAQKIWDALVASLVQNHGAIDYEWKPSKASFGWMCLLKHKKRTLVYLTPEKGTIVVAVVLGERAVELALASKLPSSIKTLLEAARPYAEGRGVRFPVDSLADVRVVCDLVACKTTPK